MKLIFLLCVVIVISSAQVQIHKEEFFGTRENCLGVVEQAMLTPPECHFQVSGDSFTKTVSLGQRGYQTYYGCGDNSCASCSRVVNGTYQCYSRLGGSQ